jgi:hypothetical protein
MKKQITLTISLTLVIIAITAACSSPDVTSAQAAANEQPLAQPARAGRNTTTPPGNQPAGTAAQGYGTGLLTSSATNDLSATEAAGLVYMFEEEKLAHEVYVQLYEIWGLPVFQNIGSSELTHMSAIQNLLERYGLAVPDASQPGVFANAELQALYTSLVAQGSSSLGAAIKVGGAIEELDILDLQERLAQVDNPDIQQVYNSLVNGSSNHLSAFANMLTSQTGETYSPQMMTQEAYQTILAGAPQGGQGRQGGHGGRGGQGGRGGKGNRSGQ